MLEIKGMPYYIKDAEVKRILTNHINKMLRTCIIYIGALTDQSKSKSFWSRRKQKELRKKICSKRITDDKERKEIILSLIRKIYSEDIEELTIEETFVLTKACYEGITIEENMIDKLVVHDDLKLEGWMWGRYMIEDTDERRKILKHLEEMKVGFEDYPKEILSEKPIQVRERILDVIGQTNMLIFEYPTAINLVFNPMEYEMLVGVQIEEGENDDKEEAV